MRSLGRYLLLVLAVNLLLLGWYGRPLIEGDGLSYYILARSLAEDGDIDVSDNRYHPDRSLFCFILNPYKQVIGLVYSGGYALVYAPFLWLARRLPVPPVLQSLRPYYEWPPFVDGLTILAANFLLLTLMMAYAVYTWSKRFPPGKILLALVLVLLGTPLLYYTFSSPSFSQFADTLAFTLFFILSLQALKERAGRWHVLAGMALGLGVTIRNINVVFALVFAIFVLCAKKQTSWQALKRLFAFGLGLLPFALFQLHYNYVQYRDCFKSGYFFQPALAWRSTLWQQLVHPIRGVFVYSPLVLLALVCLVATIRQRGSRYALALFAAFFATVQFVQYWWTGVSFGHRFSVHLYILIVYGLCVGFSRLGMKRLLVVALVLVAYSFSLFNAYVLAFYSPASRQRLLHNWERFHVGDIYAAACTAYRGEAGRHCGSAATWLSLQLNHHYPSLFFLPLANLRDRHLAFVWCLGPPRVGKGHVDVELTIASLVETTVFPRVYVYQPNGYGIYGGEQGRLLSVASLDVPLQLGFNRVRYCFFPDFSYDVYVGKQRRRRACKAEVCPDFCGAMAGKNGIVYVYLELPDKKSYVYAREFRLEDLEHFFAVCRSGRESTGFSEAAGKGPVRSPGR